MQPPPSITDLTAKTRDRLFIGGRWIESSNNEPLVLVSPDYGKAFASAAQAGIDDVDAAVAAARLAFDAGPWGRMTVPDRAIILHRLVDRLETRTSELAKAWNAQVGALMSAAPSLISEANAIARTVVEQAKVFPNLTRAPTTEAHTALIAREPVGVVAAIAPWNFPLAIPTWKVAPALLAGCGAVLKPSPLTPLTSALLVQAFADAGVPAGVLNLIQGDREAGEALVADPRVAGISFTGSLPVGQAINRAGAGRLMRTQLELGGKNALIVLEDANLDAAVDAIIYGAFGQGGQRCSATSRIIVDRKVHDALLSRLVPRIQAMRIGRGDQDWADIGPVVNDEREQACLEAVEKAVAEGAEIACGGKAVTLDTPGYFVEPTVLTNVAWDSELAQEEVFGPMVSVIACDGYGEAMRISNSVRYGMSGTIFTQNPSLMFQALQDFEAGMLHVNRPGVGSYVHLPHVGAKSSQLGAPECSPDVWNFYTDLRSACIKY